MFRQNQGWYRNIARVCLVFACLLWALVVSSVAFADDSPKDAIRQVLDLQVKAWNKGDLPGFMEGYWQSPELSFFSGNAKTAGWQATLDRYRKKYQGEGKEMGRLAFKDLSIEMLGADHALVRGRFELQMKDTLPTGIFTLIVRKLPAGWRIIHDHTSG
jgi:beta-aspartyl-peptidase (threonine type)